MNVRKITSVSLFISLSVIGAYIKIPSPIASVALDIFPALVAGVLIDEKAGAIVGAFGHFISALFGGMPLGPFHIMIAVEMALIVWLFAYLYNKSKPILSSILFVLLNGVFASVPFIFILSLEFYLALIPSLILASTVNVVLALIILPRLESIIEKQQVKFKW